MKLNKLTLAFLSMAVIAVTSCSEDEPDYTPAKPIANPATVYFSNADANKTLEVGDDDTKFTVPVYRDNKGAAQTVNVTVANPDAALFTVPSTVTFAEGTDQALIETVFVPENLTMGTDYNFTFKLEGENSPYYLTEAKVTINYITWVTLGNAQYTDDLVTGIFSAKPITYEVEIQENPGMPGLYRLVNPYGAAYPYNEPGDYDDSKDYYMYINAINPAKVFNCDKNGEPAEFATGMDWSQGEMVFVSRASFLLMNGKSADGMYGTLKNGNITFPEKSWMAMIPSYQPDGFWWANKNNEFRIVLPGFEPDLPVDTWESLGNGLWTDGYICPAGGIEPATYEVEVQENQNNPGMYRMINPYTDAFPYGGPADKDYYIEINATDPEYVLIDVQETGYAFDTQGMVSILNYSANGVSKDDAVKAGRNDKMVDGVITIGKDNTYLYMPEYDPAKIYKTGAEAKLVLPSAVSTTALGTKVWRSPLETKIRLRESRGEKYCSQNVLTNRLEKR